jgi:hypothetical protein
MTKEAYLKHKDLIEAWANGAEIEMYTRDIWVSTLTPGWSESIEYRIKHKQTIAEWLEDNNSYYITDWKDEDISKFYIAKDTESNMWGINVSYSVKSYGTVYMARETAQRLVDLLNKGEVIEG